jgi:hypothetical protein
MRGHVRLTRATTAAVAASAVLALAGCGSLFGGGTAADGTPLPSAEELYHSARSSALAAKSGHVEGFMSDENEAITVDIEGRMDGSNQRIRIGKDRGSIDVRVVKRKVYLSGDWDYWAGVAEPGVADQLAGKYVSLPPQEGMQMVGLSLSRVIDVMLPEEVSSVATFLTDVKESALGDRQVWVASNPLGGEVWVDRETGQLVRVIKSGDDAADLSFDKWNEASVVKRPAKKGTVTIPGR